MTPPCLILAAGFGTRMGALTQDRPWRKRLSYEDAVNEIKLGAGNEFDPELVLIFLDLLDQGVIQYGAK